MAIGSSISVNITGMNETLGKLMTMEKAEKSVIPILENSYRRYQFEAFKKAPVDTGRLSSNLVDDRFTEKKYKDGSYSISQRQGTYSDGEHYGAYYLLKQEYTNKNKSRFVRNSINSEYPKLMRDLIKLAQKEMSM